MPQFFGLKAVKDVVEADNSQIGLTYEDGTTEVMHKDEWEAGKSEEANPDRQSIFVKSIAPLQKETLDAFHGRNLRMDEIQLVFDWLGESLNKARGTFVSAVYGVKDWMEEATVDHCFQAIVKSSDASIWNAGDLTDIEKQVIAAFKDVKLKDVPRTLQRVAQGVQDLQKQALEAAMAKPMADWRMDDLETFIEQHPYVPCAEGGTDVEGDGDGQGGEAAGSPVEGGDQGGSVASPEPTPEPAV
jgi:hypothetical protein